MPDVAEENEEPGGWTEATMKVHKTIPILRIFDVAKALEFYREYLGFTVDWEHRFDLEASVSSTVPVDCR